MQCLCDFHIHSTLSGDGKSDLLDQVRACWEAGVRWVCFTEHIDYGTSSGISSWTSPSTGRRSRRPARPSRG